MQKIIRNMVILLFAFNVALFANSVIENSKHVVSSVDSGEVSKNIETVEVPLDSFGTLGVVVMIALSSLLGAFFMKDELSEAFK